MVFFQCFSQFLFFPLKACPESMAQGQGVNCGMEGALVLGEALVEGLAPSSGPLEAGIG